MRLRQRVAHSAVDRRRATQRIRVLHSPARNVRLPNLAALEVTPQIPGAANLAGERPRFMDAGIKSTWSASQSIHRHGADQVGPFGERLSLEQLQRAEREHGLR